MMQETERMATQADDLFIMAMALNRRAFDSRNFDHAFHALAAALHLAQVTESGHGFRLVERTAREQLDWIDQNAPEYRHSSKSARQHGNRTNSIWEGLAVTASGKVKASSAEPTMALPQDGHR